MFVKFITGGLAGAMVALYMAKRNVDIKVIEYRADFRSKLDLSLNENVCEKQYC